MEKKKLTSIIILIVAVLILLLGTFLYFHEKNKSYYLYLFTGDVNMIKWYYNEEKWYIVNNNEQMDEKFDLYLMGAYKGQYKLAFNEEWYYFDNNNESVDFDYTPFMINTNYEFTSYKYKYNFVNDDSLAKIIANKINLNISDYEYRLTEAQIYGLDDIKSIYLIDFYTPDNVISMWPSYSVAFTYNNNKVKIINHINSDNIPVGYCSLNVNGVFTFKNNKPKILISCANFDKLPGEYFLYEYSWNNYELLIKSNGGEQ